MEMEYTQFQLENTQLKLENTQLKIKIEELNKQMLEKNKQINKKSISTLLYVKQNYTNAPQLKSICESQIIDCSILIQQYNKIQIHIYIGDFIIKTYKKNNQCEQSVWNSNKNKFNFIIRKSDNDEICWKMDKNGIKFNKIVIDPIIQYVRKQISEYIQSCYEKYHYFNHSYEKDMALTQINAMTKIITSIDNKIVTRKVFNYITPHFCLNDNMLIDETIYIQI